MTILTSDDNASTDLFAERVGAAVDAGCGGIVCAVSDVAAAKELAPDLVAVVPGIRLPGGDVHDQARAGTPAATAASAVSHAATMACLQAERAAIRALGASCHAPVGVSALLDAETLHIRGFAGLPDGSEWVLDEHEAPAGDPEAAGRELARRMQLAGADDVLRRAEAMAA